MARPRPRGRPGADSHPGAGRHELCGGGGPATHRGPVRHHRAAARVRVAGSEPHPGPGPGLVACRHHRGHRPAPRCRGPGAGRGPGGGTRDHRRPHLRRGGCPAAGVHHGPAVDAHPRRLSARHRADGHRGPATQAVRVLRVGRQRHPGGPGIPAGSARRADKPHRTGPWAGLDRGHHRLSGAGCRSSQASWWRWSVPRS